MSDSSEKTATFADKLKNGLATAAKVGAAAITAASTAVVALTKASIDGYAEYEQLVGGVETLFKSSADVVQGYANNAYKTAGLSANEYMETVTSFSAALLQSLDNDTAAAAEKADLAITDMADNANKMGTSMESIQNAYQGFAKANYTMLDNLKLGYGGTKEEMQRLLEDATALSGIEYDISSYADIVDAIHVVQTEIGITGTTAKEAATTIQGSVNAAKSAWSNLVTGIAADNADFETLIGNFVDSTETAAKNVIPRITQILSGMGTAIQQLAPIIAAEVPTMISSVLPQIVSAGAQLIVGLSTGLIGALPDLIPTIVDIVLQIVEILIDNVDMLADASIEIILALAEGLIVALPTLIEKAPEIVIKLVSAIIENAPKLLSAAFELVGKIAQGIENSFQTIIDKGREIVDNVKNGVLEKIEDAKEWGKDLIDNFINGIKAKIAALKDAVSNVAQTVKDFLGFSEPKEGPLSNFHTYAPDMMQLFADGIRGNSGIIKNAFYDSLDFGSANMSDMEMPAYIRSSRMSAGSSSNIIAAINMLSAKLDSLRVYLDTGTLVGVITSDIDSNLETIRTGTIRRSLS